VIRDGGETISLLASRDPPESLAASFFSAELKAYQAGEWEFFSKPVTANQQGPPV
jgi:hypothetical protein